MLTKLRIKNFRQIEDQTFDLSQAVVIIGPNNGGKTTILQAISLFDVAIRLWGEQRIEKKSKASTRTGIAITLENLLNIPLTEYRELWRDLNLREVLPNENGKSTSRNIKIEIHAEGYTIGENWTTGFEFDYGRDSLIYARLANNTEGIPYDFPKILLQERIGYLPSVAGLNPMEDKLELGSIFRYIGSGRTADVLRNICFHLYNLEDKKKWLEFTSEIDKLFKIKLNPPLYFTTSGLLKMTYDEGAKKKMDLSSLGSGAKQAILMFAYLNAFPNTVNLLDEPDAHLEVIRQSNIYDKISDFAKKNNSQIIIASHSESVLNRAFGKDQVISAVLGTFNTVNNKKFVASILRDYGYEEFIIANQRPYVLYFEGNTDFDFLKAFCKKFNREEYLSILENEVYPYPISGNDVNYAKKHFAALKEFIPHLKGYALFDNLNRNVENKQPDLIIKQWQRREMENYLPIPQVLYAFINQQKEFGPIFENRFIEITKNSIVPNAINNLDHPFWKTTKISDDFLTPLFETFLDEMKMPRSFMDKSKFYQLVDYMDPLLVDSELKLTIDEIFKQFNCE
jgi:predicted ATPase